MPPKLTAAEMDTERLKQMLEEGLDDIDAGRTISQDEARREIEALFSALEVDRVAARRR